MSVNQATTEGIDTAVLFYARRKNRFIPNTGFDFSYDVNLLYTVLPVGTQRTQRFDHRAGHHLPAGCCAAFRFPR